MDCFATGPGRTIPKKEDVMGKTGILNKGEIRDLYSNVQQAVGHEQRFKGESTNVCTTDR